VDFELHLPWENSVLESLLLKVIRTGETIKVDFKRQLNITTAEHHAELLKDISALANTYAYAYQNHGFLIIGVTGNQLTHAAFDQSADALQARIDELVKNYIEPFIPTQVSVFGSGAQTWGAIVVLPSRTAPHVFVKDIAKRCRGDIFVRRGTTTDKASPSDYVRFFRLHLDEHTYELRQQLDDLRREVSVLKTERLSFAKSEKLETKGSGIIKEETPKIITAGQQVLSEEPSLDLLQAIDRAFAREADPIVSQLLDEARKIKSFLDTDEIPWALSHVDKQNATIHLPEYFFISGRRNQYSSVSSRLRELQPRQPSKGHSKKFYKISTGQQRS
jgi:Putative DNA-binding domain